MSMLIRRLYSSCSRSAPCASLEAAKPHTPTRGRLRLKPRVSPSQTLSKLTRPRDTGAITSDALQSLSTAGRGRKGRRSWASSSSREITSPGEGKTMNVPFIAGHSVEGFTPVHLYPVQAALHLSFTPSHLPLPINLGAGMYTTAPSTSTETKFNTDSLFKPLPRPSPVPELSRASDSALGDHQSVLSALSHPVNIHHLGSNTSMHPNLHSELEGDTVLARMIAEASVKWRLTPELEWEKTLGRLSSPSQVDVSNSTTSRTDVQSQETVEASAKANEASVVDAVTGLEALLDKLNLSQVDMTSVKRKRKQKISKHKYKKRRKVS